MLKAGLAFLLFFATACSAYDPLSDNPAVVSPQAPLRTVVEGEGSAPPEAQEPRDIQLPSLNQDLLLEEPDRAPSDSTVTHGGPSPEPREEETSETNHPETIVLPSSSEDGSAADLEAERPAEPEPVEPLAAEVARRGAVTVPAPPKKSSHVPADRPPCTYIVKNGETLWTIAAQRSVYRDALLWPLLYRANRDQIKDPRQIYPQQVLTIPRDVSEEEMEAAREKARQSEIFPLSVLLRQVAEGE